MPSIARRTLPCLALLAVFVLLPGRAVAEDAPGEGHPLHALAFLAGSFEGGGSLPGGMEYQESLTGAWILGGSALEIRSRSTVGGQVVFEDRRVLSWDGATKSLRMRQWALDRLRVYTGTVTEEGLVYEETAQEPVHGAPLEPAWRYRFAPKAGGGFDYEVRRRGDDGWEAFIRGSVGTELRDPGKGGRLGLRQYDAQIAGMAAQVHHPDGEGPYPLIVFSPGGGAESHEGYRNYGRWFATWGYVTIVVAFADQEAATRAPKFGQVIDWALAENGRTGSPLAGMVDAERVAAAGHSRGAYAALLAGAADPRVDAVLALAPSGPSEAPAGTHAPVACIVIGTGDSFLPAARTAYELQRGERFKLEVEGLTHMLQPREPVLRLVRRSTAFLEYALKGDGRYRALVVEEAPGLEVDSAAARAR